MYIIDNAATASNVPIWTEILKMLKAGGNLGRSIELECPRHPEVPIEVKEPDDFIVFSPEGGCDKKLHLQIGMWAFLPCKMPQQRFA